jgi:hypothetical protein
LGGIEMKKLIMFIFFLLSLATMILLTITISELFTFLGLGTFELEIILEQMQESPIEDVLPSLGLVMWGLFQLYGIPLIVFLVSLNGLTNK